MAVRKAANLDFSIGVNDEIGRAIAGVAAPVNDVSVSAQAA
jgi:hypothetical protein